MGWLNNIVSVPLSPIQKLFSLSGQKIEGSLSFFKDVQDLKKENEELKAKIDQLEKDNNELSVYKDKIKELKDALNLKDQFYDYEFVGANIIAKDAGNWFGVFRVDRGSGDGISKDSPVITSRGLVGRVISSDILSSKIVSIIDEDCTVSARISKSRQWVLVKGDVTLKNQGLCRLDYISPEVDIDVGDTIETSGDGGIFPKGLMIGKVKEIRHTNNEMNRYAIVEPSVDFKKLEEIVILKGKNNNAGTGSAER